MDQFSVSLESCSLYCAHISVRYRVWYGHNTAAEFETLAHGISALLGHFDFIYCMPSCWLAVPFSFLGIIAEGGSSATFVNRSRCLAGFIASPLIFSLAVGQGKANEVLLWGKRQTAEDLLSCGFVKWVLIAYSV